MKTRKNKSMWARKLVNELLVAGPFLMLAIISIRTRTNFDPWEAPRNTAEVEARVDAYVEPVRAITLLGQDPAPEAVRSVAKRWLEAADSKRLLELPPCSYLETVRDGVKGQIVTEHNRLCMMVYGIAEAEKKAGDSDRAASDALLAYRLAEVVKYSDFSTVYECSRNQIRFLEFLANVAPAAPRSGNEVRRVLKSSDVQLEKLNRVLYRMRTLHQEAMRARGQEALPIEDVQQYAQIGTLIQTRCDVDNLRQVRRMILASNGDMPHILTVTKQAWQIESRRAELAQRVLRLCR